MLRSTKGASKHRRDLINNEISVLRDMLPLPESARQRLSQLQIMSLSCCYIRKCNYLARLFGNTQIAAPSTESKPFEFSQSMTGFLLITTREGKLLYISENVTEYLGHSMVDMMTQGDSIYDIIDKRDHQTVQGQLLQATYSPEAEDERTFFCRMNVSRSFRRQAGFGDHKVMHVTGHFIQPIIRDHYGNQPVFMAICSPLITPDMKETAVQNNTCMYQSVHGLDMKYVEIAQNGEHYLGYADNEMYGKSWYELLHPEDIMEAKDKHMQLIKSSHEMGCMLTVRLQAKEGHWVWVNIVMHIRQPYVCENGDPAIVCINQIIADSEAPHFKMQSQLYSSHIARSPEFLGQGGSPPHTITQVAVERDTVSLPFSGPATMGGQEGEGATYYQGEFAIHQTPLGGKSGCETVHSSPKGMSYCDSGSDRSGSPSSQSSREGKPMGRADILNQLKRKIEMSSQQCKPAKMPKFSQSDNSHHGGNSSGITIQGSAFITGTNYYGSMGGSMGQFNAGPVELMGPMSQGPVFAELGLKKAMDVEMGSPKAASPVPAVMTDFCQPLTPPTPTSSVMSEDTTQTNLTIDISMCDTTLIPQSMLTPESSPTTSPTSKEAQPEQQVPGFDIHEVLGQLDVEDTLVHPPVEQKKHPQLKVKKSLPIIDLLTLEDFLSSVEVDKVNQTVLPVVRDPVVAAVEKCHESPAASPAQYVNAASPAQYVNAASPAQYVNVASPAQYVNAASPAQYVNAASPAQYVNAASPAQYVNAASPAQYVNAASPAQYVNVASPAMSEEEEQLLTEAMTENQLDGLVASVTQALLDMVQDASDVNNANVLGEFMLIPSGSSSSSGSSSGDVSLSVCSQPSPARSCGNPAEVPCLDLDHTSPLTGDLLDELHQLNRFTASSTPSYGDESIPTTVFDKSL